MIDDDYNKIFISFMKEQEHRVAFFDKYFSQNGLCAYYIAPLYNIKNAINDGGIKARNNVDRFYIDLSYQKIQLLRDKELALCNNSQYKKSYLHNCINLFLNPINDTLYQFRRNSIINQFIKRYKKYIQDSQLLEIDFDLLIVEFDLEGLLQLPNIYWTVTNKNIAIADAKCSYDIRGYKDYEWDKIFSVRNKFDKDKQELDLQDKNNIYRSAEFIVNTQGTNYNYIPISLIRRILTLGGNIQEIQNYLGNTKFNIKLWEGVAELSISNEPLYTDRKLFENLVELGPKVRKSFAYAINQLVKESRRIVPPLQNCFLKDSMAQDDRHGVKHVIRVMFWVLFLAKIMNIQEEEAKRAFLAAFIHDLGRMSHREDNTHGRNARINCSKLISPYISPDKMESCLEAVEYHCKEEEPQNADIVYRLMKDADAMDRGRFGAPKINNNSKNKGVDLFLLKLKIPNIKKLAWLGYMLPRIHRYASFSDKPARNLKYTVLTSIEALACHGSLNKEELAIAKELISSLQ